MSSNMRLLAWLLSLVALSASAQMVITLGLEGTAGGGVPPAPENTTSAKTTSSSTLTISSHVVTSADYLIVLVQTGSSVLANRTVTSVVRDGTESLSSCGWAGNDADDGNWVRTEAWCFDSPAAGTADIVVTVSADQISAGATGWIGVNDTTPITGAAGANGADSSPTVTITCTTDDVVVAGLASEDNVGVASDNTQLWEEEQVGNDTTGAGSYDTGATSVDMSWTLNVNGWGIGGFCLKAE